MPVGPGLGDGTGEDYGEQGDGLKEFGGPPVSTDGRWSTSCLFSPGLDLGITQPREAWVPTSLSGRKASFTAFRPVSRPRRVTATQLLLLLELASCSAVSCSVLCSS